MSSRKELIILGAIEDLTETLLEMSTNDQGHYYHDLLIINKKIKDYETLFLSRKGDRLL